jgi:tRNA nucleotidyltransferase/poly(A) polymerase
MEKDRYEIYYVGGCVRDKLLGIESKDIDFTFVINPTPDEIINIYEGFQLMEKWLNNEGFTIFLSTPDMLTIRAKFPKNEKYIKQSNMTADFVLARKETYPDPNSRFPAVKLGSLHDDLMRRDFTVNALAIDMKGNLIDICDGFDDIRLKLLRTPMEPRITLMDDPLRVLRAMRFHITKQFEFDDDLLIHMTTPEILDKLFTVVSLERIREELTKMFNYSTPQTLKLLNYIESKSPNFIDKLFISPLKLVPTTKIK